MPLMGYLTLTLVLLMAVATFIENDFGTEAARDAVYNSWLFELVMLLFIINLTGSMILNKTYRKKKFTIFLFHIAFVIIFLGAAVTRYISYEGTMHIREGESTNVMMSYDKYVYGVIEDHGQNEEFSFKVNFIQGQRNKFKKHIYLGNKDYTIKFLSIVADPQDKMSPPVLFFDLSDGKNTKRVSVLEARTAPKDTEHINFGNAWITLHYGHKPIELPFSLYLKDFKLERYPGSQSPSSYVSDVVLKDKERGVEMPYSIFMNHTLKYRGFKFFQSSYDMDEGGTILSVNHDNLGTALTYIGYFLMALGMILSIFNKNSRFMKLARKTGVSGKSFVTVLAALIMLLANGISGNVNAENKSDEGKIIPANAAKEFSTVLLQAQNGRIEPFYTMASDVLRKVLRKSRYKGLDPVQVVLGMYFFQDKWKHEPIIRLSGKAIPGILGVKGRYASYSDFFGAGSHYSYKLSDYVQKAYHKRPAERNMFDNDIIRVDERLNVCYLVYSGSLFKLFPVKNDPDNYWYPAHEASLRVDSVHARFVSEVLFLWANAVITDKDPKEASKLLNELKTYQRENGSELIPSESKIRMEILYEKYDVFGKLTLVYSIVGFVLLIMLFVRILKQENKGSIGIRIATWILLAGFVFHTAGLGVRWYISGHAPWSNGYESMIYIAWAAMLAGLVFVRNTPFALASAAILSALTLFVAHLSWMNPEITNLVPVLKSYWLTIHVSVITASYGFLGMGLIIGLVNLVLYIVKTKENHARIQKQIEILTNVNEMALILGVYFFGIGTFLGGVWANESWGRYWGWDPKETWSLITGLIYVFVVHMRFIPGLRGYFAYNMGSILAFFSVIMTYFGVNYYLSGLHSYAQGDPVPIPAFVFYALAGLLVMVLFAWFRERKFSDNK